MTKKFSWIFCAVILNDSKKSKLGSKMKGNGNFIFTRVLDSFPSGMNTVAFKFFLQTHPT